MLWSVTDTGFDGNGDDFWADNSDNGFGDWVVDEVSELMLYRFLLLLPLMLLLLSQSSLLLLPSFAIISYSLLLLLLLLFSIKSISGEFEREDEEYSSDICRKLLFDLLFVSFLKLSFVVHNCLVTKYYNEIYWY